MDYDYYINAIKVIAVADSFGYLNLPRVEREFWIHPFHLVREQSNRFFTFYREIRKYPNKFFEYCRMSISSYEKLLDKLRPHRTRKMTKFQRPEEKLTIIVG